MRKAILALAVLTLAGIGYEAHRYVNAVILQAQVAEDSARAWQFLATPVAKTLDGKDVRVGDILLHLVTEEVARQTPSAKGK